MQLHFAYGDFPVSLITVGHIMIYYDIQFLSGELILIEVIIVGISIV